MNIAKKNFLGRPKRSIALVMLVALLSFSICAGTMVVASLRQGLSSLENRLGADIMVVPYEATTKTNLSNIVLQGSTGSFYMDSSNLKKISEMDGVGQITSQFFLATLSAGCCSVPVQIIGFDPDTDFSILPWVKESYKGSLNDLEVIVGNDLNAFSGDTLTFYSTDVKVAGKLKKTGTALDTAVYATNDTVKELIEASMNLKVNTFSDVDPDKVVSCILINVADGYTVEDVLNDINIHVRKVEAIQTKNMISDVADSLNGISKIIGIMVIAVWILSVAILSIVFIYSIKERTKEFAVLRAIGASKGMVSRIVMEEGLYTGIIGGLIGTALAVLIVIPFSGLIEETLGVPFLLPGMGLLATVVIVAFMVSATAAALTCAAAGMRVAKAEPGIMIREA